MSDGDSGSESAARRRRGVEPSKGSDNDASSSKKRKASRACDRCNSQHQPCDNATPRCSVCERAGVAACTYDRPVRKRGPRSGYTGQGGERLWAVVLAARPDLEDEVLRLLLDPAAPPLREGGQGSGTGARGGSAETRNIDHLRSPANQADLVARFAATRLGRLIQGAASEDDPDLRLPPVAEEYHHPLPPAATPGQTAVYSGPDLEGRPPMHGPAATTAESTLLGRGGGPPSYHGDGKALGAGGFSLGSLPETPVSSSISIEGDGFGFDFGEGFNWLDPAPTDTLLNLGFVEGDSMAEDFLDLCQNPDPVRVAPPQSSSAASHFMGHNEEEEDVWRRLVMRGRFV